MSPPATSSNNNHSSTPLSVLSQSATMRDPNSVSNYHHYVTKHLALDWIIDFDRKVIKGTTTLTMAPAFDKAERSPVVKLDSKGLKIDKIMIKLKEKDPIVSADKFIIKESKFGEELEVTLPSSALNPAGDASPFDLIIEYSTTEQCSAVQWLTKEQTAGKQYPYLFTQCQAIHARSMLPCQDTPAVKSTYSAKVTVPMPLVAVMSANRRKQTTVSSSSTVRIFEFEQTTPIPAYLIALGVGNLGSKSIGPRSTLWSEPEVLDRGAWEFADTESFIATAEQLTMAYQWGIYDILLLPPSFPYGGMENPCLTFLTPSLLAGDRSLVDVVAHEIAHSWTGNLVTNSTWEHFWLNEGFTMFLERKILGRLHGEQHRHLDAIVGLGSLRDSIAQFPEDSPATRLVPDLSETSPDDVYSTVPYEKGHTMLMYLEQLVGGSVKFEPYLAAHISRFAGKSIGTDEWLAFLLEHFKTDPKATSALDQVDWQSWLYAPGMPPKLPIYDDTLVKQVRSLANTFISQGKQAAANATYRDNFDSFTLQQKLVFLDHLIDNRGKMSLETLEALDSALFLSEYSNVEVCLKWFMLRLHLKDHSCFTAVCKYVTQHGRMKYNRPLYRLMAACSPDAARLAKETFDKHRAFYHPIAVGMIEKDLAKYLA